MHAQVRKAATHDATQLTELFVTNISRFPMSLCNTTAARSMVCQHRGLLWGQAGGWAGPRPRRSARRRTARTGDLAGGLSGPRSPQQPPPRLGPEQVCAAPPHPPPPPPPQTPTSPHAPPRTQAHTPRPHHHHRSLPEDVAPARSSTCTTTPHRCGRPTAGADAPPDAPHFWLCPHAQVRTVPASSACCQSLCGERGQEDVGVRKMGGGGALRKSRCPANPRRRAAPG